MRPIIGNWQGAIPIKHRMLRALSEATQIEANSLFHGPIGAKISKNLKLLDMRFFLVYFIVASLYYEVWGCQGDAKDNTDLLR